MTRIEEIDARLTEIRSLDKEKMSIDELKNLNTEVTDLKEERKLLESQIQKRNQLVTSIIDGTNGSEPIVVGKGINQMEPKKTFKIDTPEYRTAFLKNLQGKNLDAEERAAVDASKAIPSITMDKVVFTLETNPLLGAIDLTQIPGNLIIPKEGSVADAEWTQTATDSSDTLDAINLAAYQLIKTVEITGQVAKMAIDAFESWLVTRLANKIEAALEKAVVAGTGKMQPTGLNTVYKTTANTYTKGGMKYADITKIIGALPSKYANNASFVCTRTLFFGQILGMTDTNGKPIVVADAQSPAKFNILGYPVFLNDDAAFVYFGDLKSYKMNLSQPIEVSKDTSVGFRSNSEVYRGVCLADGNVADEDAIVAFKETA